MNSGITFTTFGGGFNIASGAFATIAVFWPSPSPGFVLQQNTNSVSSVNWSNAPGPIQNDTTKTNIVNPPPGNRFYRLYKP